MQVDGVHHRTIRVAEDGAGVEIIDQTKLPHAFEIIRLDSVEQAASAIADMRVRGAPLIGVTGAYGISLQMRTDASDFAVRAAHATLLATRPTAVNLGRALDAIRDAVLAVPEARRVEVAYAKAAELADEDAELCRSIGVHGLPLFEAAFARAEAAGRERLNVLTHCNAGWLATVDYGTALSPIYRAHDAGLPVHVWVDETRPRNQGSSLTAWELGEHGVPHTVVSDNAGGHLMQRGEVDLCITGSDRVTASGDVCNKIGTYLKALAARDNGVPFYAAFPYSTIDWSRHDGVGEIPIEERDPREVSHIAGLAASGEVVEVALLPPRSAAANPAFDVTPARLVEKLVTDRGVCDATAAGLAALYPEHQLHSA
ncbi:MAG: S-methyl-5-thioribose-1-phosphate isomerase [Myxococcales bacterium]|nr:S-methyl-5-thioribose-1-phosphate isomerase [Myxococcales bacterium]